MRKRQLYILSLLSVFCAFGNNCVYGQESSDSGQERNVYEQNGFAYGQQNSAFGQKSSQFPMERLDRGLVALPERESVSVGDSSVQTARMSVLI